MAKVMISLPDELLERLDESARRCGTSRSGYLRELAERHLDAEGTSRIQVVEELLSHAEPRGGDAVELVRELRQSR